MNENKTLNELEKKLELKEEEIRALGERNLRLMKLNSQLGAQIMQVHDLLREDLKKRLEDVEWTKQRYREKSDVDCDNSKILPCQFLNDQINWLKELRSRYFEKNKELLRAILPELLPPIMSLDDMKSLFGGEKDTEFYNDLPLIRKILERNNAVLHSLRDVQVDKDTFLTLRALLKRQYGEGIPNEVFDKLLGDTLDKMKEEETIK